MRRGDSGESRLMALLASLCFSIPTSAFVWFAANRELAFWQGYLGSGWLWGSILLFSVVAFASPRLFPSLIGAIWRVIHRLALGWW